MFSKDDIGLIGICLGGVALLISVIASRKSTKVAKVIGKTIDDLSEKDIAADITKTLIEKAVDRNVKQQVENMLPGVAIDAIKSARMAFKAVIEEEVNKQYADTKNEVKRALKERVGRIDISDVKREVVEDAKEEAEDKFRDELDNVLESFNNKLEDVGKVYTSIARKFAEK